MHYWLTITTASSSISPPPSPNTLTTCTTEGAADGLVHMNYCAPDDDVDESDTDEDEKGLNVTFRLAALQLEQIFASPPLP